MERKSGEEGTLLLIGGVVLAALAWPQIQSRLDSWMRKTFAAPWVSQVTQLLPWLVGAVVLLLLLVLALRVMWQRRRHWQALLAEAVDAPMAKGYDPDAVLRKSGKSFDLAVTKWRWLVKPAAVKIFYPASAPDRDPEWTSTLERVVEDRAGWPAVKSVWRRDKLVVVMKRAELVPVEPLSPEEESRQGSVERATKLLAPIFGVPIKLSVSEWVPASGEAALSFPGGYPSRFVIDYESMTRDVSENWRRRLETVVALKLPPAGVRWRGTYETERDRITLAHAPELPAGVIHPGIAAWKGNKNVVLPYGVAEDNLPVSWKLTGPGANLTVHTLVIGPTGGGKTTLIRSIVVGGTAQGVHVFGADPKRIELTPFRGWPGVHAVASSPEDMAELIRAMHTLMQARYDAVEAGAMKTADFEPVVFILDEFLILQGALNRWWAANKAAAEGTWGTKTGTKHPALAMVEEMIVLARSAQIRLLIGVQRPDAELFDKGTRDSLRHRVSLARLSRQGAEMLWGDSFTGTDTPMVVGRAFASPDGGAPIETQTYWVPDPSSARTPEEVALMEELWEASDLAFKDRPLPEGLDLSALSSRALAQPEAAPEVAAPAEQVSEVGELTTQLVPADSLMTGDRIINDDGQVFTVVTVEESEAGDDETWVSVEVLPSTVTGELLDSAVRAREAGKPVSGLVAWEGPSDSTAYPRVIELEGEHEQTL